MRFLVISDIHGCAVNLKTVLNTFDGKYDVIICCGDFLYHGPRNGVPDEYNPKETMALLESIKDKIVGVRGNCDGEVDQMVLNFPIMSENLSIPVLCSGKVRKLFVHHGHKYSLPDIQRMVSAGSVIISGHTHVSVLETKAGYVWFNPGSISLPKCDDGKTCGIIETGDDGKIKIELCSITGNVIKSLEV